MANTKPLTVAEARLQAQAIMDAITRAEAEGRDTLAESDLDAYRALADEARAASAAAIANTKE